MGSQAGIPTIISLTYDSNVVENSFTYKNQCTYIFDVRALCAISYLSSKHWDIVCIQQLKVIPIFEINRLFYFKFVSRQQVRKILRVNT